MAFHDVRFPVAISYGSSGGPGFNTQIIEVESGAEERVARWPEGRHQYNVSERVKSLDDLYDIKEFYIARRGAFASFRFKDFADFTTGLKGTGATGFDDENIGPGNGTKTVFQLVKRYVSGPINRIRTITKPVVGTVRISIGGIEQFSGFTIDHTIGKVTFTVAPGAAIDVGWGGEFDTEVRFGQGADQLLSASHESFEQGEIPSIPLIEVISENAIPDEFLYGGSIETDISGADLSLNLSTRGRRLINTTAGRKLFMPAIGLVTGGGPWFYLQLRPSSTQNVLVRASDDTALFTLTPGDTKTAVIMKDGSSTEWVFFG